MKQLRVNIEKITAFDLKLARNPRVVALLDDIISLPLEERAQKLNALQQKIQQGEADLFEERVLTKLLEQRTAEWIRVIHKNLPAIEKEFEKRNRSQPLPANRPSAQASAPSIDHDEYPSEILELLATQKPPPIPKSAKQSSPSWQTDRTIKKRSIRGVKDIVVGMLLIGLLLGAIWYVLSSKEVSAPIRTFDAQAQQSSEKTGTSAQQQQQIQTQFDTAAHELRFGEFEEGRTQLFSLIETYPDSSYGEKAYLLLADTYRQRQNNPDEALKYYQLFTEKFPESQHLGLVQLKMGFTYEDLEDTANAEEMYRLLINQKGKKSRLGQLANERLSKLLKR